MLRRVARADRGTAVDRGWDASDLSHPPGPLGCGPGAPGPAAAHPRHGVGRGRDRTAGDAHTGATALSPPGSDLRALRDLRGHASPETTGKYVHLSAETLAAEYTA